MPRRPSLLVAIGALLAAVAAARGAGTPDARALLDQVSRTYRGLTSFHFQGMVGVKMNRKGATQNFDFPVIAAGVKPGRWRTEMQNPVMGMTLIADGRTVVTYSQQLNQYTRKPAPPRDATADSVAGVAGPGSPLARYFSISRSLVSARWLRTQSLPLGSRRALCDVVEVVYEHPQGTGAVYSPTTFWIERGRAVVLRDSTHVRVQDPQGGQSELAQTTTFTTARINERLPDTLFVFHPPAGATEVASFKGSEEVDLSGQKAEDFTLDDVAGKSLRLSSLKGKVVLIDFWATWCGPCRIEMPNIQKLHREFRNKGLVVLGVNAGEEASAVRPFLKKYGYDFRILLDRDQAVGKRYQVGGIPTLFIIDKSGTISSHFVGVRDEATLREALAKAGIQ
ncbi:MAG TPA: redoxin domain-containing protein [Candidatus Eisenbacteria bacterium]